MGILFYFPFIHESWHLKVIFGKGMGNIQTSGLNEAVLISGDRDRPNKNSPQNPQNLSFQSTLSKSCNAKQCNAMKTSSNKTYFKCLHYFRRLLRLDFKEDSCGRLGLGLVACDRCAEVSSERQNHSYLCCIHYADINEIKIIEIWISNQTLCWIPLKITKIHFLSLKLSALLLSKADGGGRYYFLSQ